MRLDFAFRRIEDVHARRTAGLLLILWLLASCDFLFTVWAQRFTPLHEVNPWASGLLHGHQIASLGLGKCALTVFGTIVFWRTRNRAVTKVGLWGVVVVHVALMVRWSNYTTAALELGRVDPEGESVEVTYLPPIMPPPQFLFDPDGAPNPPSTPAPSHPHLAVATVRGLPGE